MKKAIALAVLITMAALPVSAQISKDRRVEEEIKRLNPQEVEALLHNDVKTLGRTWSDDFVVTNPFNKFVNKKQVTVVAGRETVVWAGKIPTAGKTSHLRFTAIWMKQGGRWQEVSRHANIVVQQ